MQERTPSEVLRLMKDEGIEVVDLRFCDLPGLMQHFSIPAHVLTEETFTEGNGFDGSSIRGFQQIHESDMILLPDPSTAVVDPFRQHKTLNLNCFVHDPLTLEHYSRDPRYVAQKAEAHLTSTGVADTSYFGPEAEFFIFDDVRFSQDQHSAFYQVDSIEGIWNSAREENPNLGYKPRYKEGYFPVPPMDHFQDLRSEMILVMEKMGIEIEVQHHEVGTAGQAEIDMRFDTLLKMADKLMLYKYVVKSVANQAGFTATFMPKPLFDDNGSGMHVHSSLWNGSEPLFHQEGTYAGLSDIGRWYIGGIIKHARSVLASRPRRRTPTSVSFLASRRRSTWSTPSGTDQPRAGSPSTRPARRRSGWSSGAPTPAATHTSPSRPSSWPGSTAWPTASSRRRRWTRTSSTCRVTSWPRSVRSPPRWRRRWTRWRPIRTT